PDRAPAPPGGSPRRVGAVTTQSRYRKVTADHDPATKGLWGGDRAAGLCTVARNPISGDHIVRQPGPQWSRAVPSGSDRSARGNPCTTAVHSSEAPPWRSPPPPWAGPWRPAAGPALRSEERRVGKETR